MCGDGWFMILFGCCYAGMLVSPEGLSCEFPPPHSNDVEAIKHPRR